MHQPCVRSIRRPLNVWRAGILIVTVAAAILANSATASPRSRSNVFQSLQQRDEAPIWHVQPRMQDLPSGLAQEEETLLEPDDIAEKLDMIQKRISVDDASRLTAASGHRREAFCQAEGNPGKLATSALGRKRNISG
jgi:hypothetical protein